MPAFGRLHKHSNRSQHALVDAGAPAVTTAATAPSPGSLPPDASYQAPSQHPSQHPGQHPTQLQHPSHQHSHPNSHSNSPATTATPISALSSSNPTGFSSSEDFETRPHHKYSSNNNGNGNGNGTGNGSDAPLDGDLLPPLQQGAGPAAPGGPGPGPGPAPAPSSGGPPPFDDRRQHRARGSDFADNSAPVPVGRSQSQRYSTILPANSPILPSPHQHPHPHQQQQPYGPIASSSVDDLPSTAAHPSTVQVQFPERRSARKLIKGIFGGSSSRSSNTAAPPPPDPQQQPQLQGQGPGHAHHNSYDNTSGLARRPSKRAVNPPNLKTAFSGHQPSQPPPGHEWHPQDPYSQQSSPLQGVDEREEYRYSAHDSRGDLVSQDSRNPLNTTIRQVSGEVETSPYDDVYHQQQQPQPPPHQHQQAPLSQGQVPHSQDQQLRYEQGNYEQKTVPSPPTVQQFPYSNPHQGHYQPPADPRLVTSHLGAITQHQLQQQQPQNPETLSQVSHESPITDPDQRSTNQHSAQTSPAVNYSSASIDLASTQSPPPVQPGNTQQSQSDMSPASGPPPSRRGQEAADKALRQGEQPPGGPPPPGYRHSTASMAGMPVPPPPGQGGPQTPGYRGERPPQFDGPPGDPGRNSPQPPLQDPAEVDKSLKDLLLKYKNVKRLYFDGKSQIEQLTAQVEHLQNAVANQRMSQSRTALDDNEYSTRFNRLNGAIQNLSFNIRKDWRTVPQWLEQYVSVDALKTGKQEMTAVGRAVVSRWLVEEFFDKCFHPGLEPELSGQLKQIELSIRGSSYTLHSQEEFDALTTKIVNWRMTTLDGLKATLDPATTTENRTNLTDKATTNLTACLYQYLGTPPPPGVEGSTSMIVELAVAIAANLPLESRDVAIMYPLPGDIVQPHLMDVEKAGLPVLELQKSEGGADADEDSDRDKNGKARGDKPKTGMLNAMLGGAPQQGRKGSVASSIGQSSTDVDNFPALPKDNSIVRFAGFMALEVRGRQVLMKAPVWTL